MGAKGAAMATMAATMCAEAATMRSALKCGHYIAFLNDVTLRNGACTEGCGRRRAAPGLVSLHNRAEST